MVSGIYRWGYGGGFKAHIGQRHHGAVKIRISAWDFHSECPRLFSHGDLLRVAGRTATVGRPWLDFTLAGLLGAFTTFLTFSIQAYMLIVNGRRALALGYIMASVLVCVLAVAVGVFLTRTLINH